MLDLHPLGNISDASRVLTEIARELRKDRVAHMACENSLVQRISGTSDQFVDRVTKDYLGGDQWERYLELLADETRLEALLQMAEPALARLSPVTLALILGRERRNPYDATKFARYTSNALVNAIAGRSPTTIVASWPPRHGKTTLISRRAAEWVLINDPSKNVGVCGYSDDFASIAGRTARNDIRDSPSVFGFGISSDSSAAQSWMSDHGGTFWCAGVHGSATGRGASFLVIDDPVKDMADAQSLAARDENWSWYTSTARTRLEMGALGICCIQTRWHEDDLAGRILANATPGEVVEIRFPAVAEAKDSIGREPGQALWPARYPLESLEKTRRDIGEESWCALMMQSPIGASKIGRVYQQFEPTVHVRSCSEDTFDPGQEILVSMDFNVNPWSCCMGQAMDHTTWMDSSRQYVLTIFDELSIPDCNTAQGIEAVGERLMKWARGARLKLRVTADASGARRQTSATNLGGDHQIIKDYFNRRTGQFKCTYDFEKSNLSVRESVAQVNRQMRSADNLVHFVIDPRCRETITDLGSSRWARDVNLNFLDTIDSKDPRRGHSGDALRYLVRSMRKSGIRYGDVKESLPR